MEAASIPTPAGRRAARGGRLLRLRTDDQLVASFRLGHDEAFRVIHDRYRARLFAYTRQMLPGSRADAEDALQDVFLRAYGALRADDRPVTLRAWLYRVAHNRCVDHLRRPANQPTEQLFEVAGLHDPLADIQRRDDLRRLVEDLRRLPEQQRSALLMRELEGLSYAELGDALAVSVPAVKSLLVRARIGLTEEREARDTACVEIRADLLGAQDRGVRMDARSRRHLRDCAGCSAYRGQLKRVRTGLAALGGGGATGLGALAKLLGLGGAGGGAAAAGGGGGAVTGGALVAGGTAKVAALVCCAAVVGGGAVEASRTLKAPAREEAPAKAQARALARPRPPALTATPRGLQPVSATTRTPEHQASVPRPGRDVVVVHADVVPHPSVPAVLADPVSPGASSADEEVRQAAAVGGMLAPDDEAGPVDLDDAGAAPPAETRPALPVVGPATGTTGP